MAGSSRPFFWERDVITISRMAQRLRPIDSELGTIVSDWRRETLVVAISRVSPVAAPLRLRVFLALDEFLQAIPKF